MKKLFVISLISAVLFLNLYSVDRDQRQQPQKVMDKIGLKKGMVVGVAGAGRGYFTFHMSKRVGKNGRIYANEISQYNLDYINQKCKRENVNNVTTILGKLKDPLFPRDKMDMVFMCYVFHDLEKPVEFLKSIKKSLKPGATVVIMDQDPAKTGDDHFFTKEVLLKHVKDANYAVIRTETFLDEENIFICRPNL